MSWISTIFGAEAPQVWTKNLNVPLLQNDYSALITSIVLQPIFDGLKKIEFYNNGKQDSEIVGRVVEFLNNNYNNIFIKMFNDGFVAIHDDGKNIELVKTAKINKEKIDGIYYITNQRNARFTETFQMFGISDKALLFNILQSFNLYCNAEDTIIQRLGQTTLFSADASNGEAKILDDPSRLALENMLNGVLGADDSTGKSVFVTKSGLTRNTIQFDLQRMNLTEKKKLAIAFMAGKMNIPEDLIPTLGSKTFANLNEAKDYFKQNTINGWAEIMLELGRKCIKSSKEVTPSEYLDFKLL